MTMPTGTLNFSQLQAEFGGGNPISLSEYYRGGAYVSAGTTDAGYGQPPASGAITLGTFRGTRAFRINDGAYGYLANTSSATGIRSVTFTLFTDGTSNTGGGWGLPTTAGIGSSYWAYASTSGMSGGSVYSGTLNTWIQLSSNYGWSFHNTSTGGEGTGTLDVALSASNGGAVLGYVHCNFDCGRIS